MSDQKSDRDGRLIGGLIVFGIGTIFLLRSLGYLRIDDWWPLLMMIVGVAMIASYFARGKQRGG